MRKKISLLVMLLMILVLASGCGSSDPVTELTSTSTSLLRFLNEDEIELNREQLEKLIRIYEGLDIKVEVTDKDASAALKEIKAVLTADQWKIIEADVKEREALIKERSSGSLDLAIPGTTPSSGGMTGGTPSGGSSGGGGMGGKAGGSSGGSAAGGVRPSGDMPSQGGSIFSRVLAVLDAELDRLD